MKIYLKTDNIQAAKNTAISAKAVMECEIILDSTKNADKVESDLWTLGDVEEITLQAGDLVVKSFSKKPKIYEGETTVMRISDALKKYHVVRLTAKTQPMWWDYYNRLSKKLGGYTTQWL